MIDLATNTVRQLTFGEGSNESPSWAPNGRHLAFSSTRAGKTQIFTLARDGKNLKGRALGLVLGTVGKRVLETAFQKTVKAIEARNSDSVEGGSQMPARPTT